MYSIETLSSRILLFWLVRVNKTNVHINFFFWNVPLFFRLNVFFSPLTHYIIIVIDTYSRRRRPGGRKRRHTRKWHKIKSKLFRFSFSMKHKDIQRDAIRLSRTSVLYDILLIFSVFFFFDSHVYGCILFFSFVCLFVYLAFNFNVTFGMPLTYGLDCVCVRTAHGSCLHIH